MSNVEIVIAVIAAGAAIVLVVAVAVAARRAEARSEKRLTAVLGQLDRHLESLSGNLLAVVERSENAGARESELGLTLDLQEVVDRVTTEAATRTGSDAAAALVPGPADDPVTASFGATGGAGLLAGSLLPPDGRPIRTARLAWSYGHLADDDGAFHAGLVVPVGDAEGDQGALAVYSRSVGALGEDEAAALERLAFEAAPAIANARRFAEAELLALMDPLTDVRNRRGYDEELDREVARARRTGRPLALLLLDLDDFKDVNTRFDYPGGDEVLRTFAGILLRVARATDIVCRRGGEEFAVLLPETTCDEATQFHGRLNEVVAMADFPYIERQRFSAGLVEWRPNETPESLDLRASAAVNRAKRAGKDRLESDCP